MTLKYSRDQTISKAAPPLITGRKWTPSNAVQHATSALRHSDIVGHVQLGRGDFGLISSKPTWCKASTSERRKMVVEEPQPSSERDRKSPTIPLLNHGQLAMAWDWKMLVNIGQQQIFPPELAATTLRRDLVFWSPSLNSVYITELPWENSTEEAYDLQKEAEQGMRSALGLTQGRGRSLPCIVPWAAPFKQPDNPHDWAYDTSSGLITL
ncbi:hypothetical protein D5F01_LYC13834 [Larimichthys crocea]|uniref:Uncharacterized protein n=1 Tax=Larimichthys crocea TaxID=215358 RepID=A0A6G0I8T8_LARCR|nr:hypothetical protein D5F01_LYC13834 [Larimichthys crocea]